MSSFTGSLLDLNDRPIADLVDMQFQALDGIRQRYGAQG